jgi:hypothetical protein
VHVEVAEEGLALRIVMSAGHAFLAAGEAEAEQGGEQSAAAERGSHRYTFSRLECAARDE